MLQRTAFSYSLQFTLCAVFISFGICCSRDEWECGSGQCIAKDSLCDGATDCTDSSDERAHTCIHQVCPSSAFQCAYGACVDGGAKCNKIKDCADNSDETLALCQASKQKKSSCSGEQFQCSSGECISLDNVCDGQSECQDQSDEMVDTCVAYDCLNSFRCANGDCITRNKTCDGELDCKYDSDEAGVLCGKQVKKPISKPPTTIKKRSTRAAAPPGVKGCRSPNVPNSRVAYESEPTRFVSAGQFVPDSTSITYSCETGYKLEGSSFNYCSDSEWVVSPDPKCVSLKDTRPSPSPASGCKAPFIPFSRLVYEFEPSKVILPEEIVPGNTSITYECLSGYTREGKVFNFCKGSQWVASPHPECIKYCPADNLKGVTFKTECKREGITVSCQNQIKPGTVAEISCQIQYQQQEQHIDSVTCGADGRWDYQPQRCIPICGNSLPKFQKFISFGDPENITYVPWHVGIYQSFSGRFKHICGASIISANIVVSAAHCFWDKANQIKYESSFFAVGAGKYYRDYYKDEQYAQFQNVSLIHIPNQFSAELNNYKSDIAVIVLTNYLTFSPFVAPVCIDWKDAAEKAIDSNILGKIAGWGLNENNEFSIDLRTATISTTSYTDCLTSIAEEWTNSVTTDKFCVLNKFGTTVCQGDSGGGFTVERPLGRKTKHYLWGIVSGGVPSDRVCKDIEFVTYTNIQYYESYIKNFEIKKTMPTPPPTTKMMRTPSPASGCIAPSIPFTRLVYELESSKVIFPGGIVPDYTSITYQCLSGYTREGINFNFCKDSQWVLPHPECIKYCPSDTLKGVTFKAECKREGITVPCQNQIKPGTVAEITCQIQYQQQDSHIDYMICQAEGRWDYQPKPCIPICGENMPKIQELIAFGERENITYVPWHVGIYQSFSGSFDYICGASVISANIVVSAAHCFWDSAKRMNHAAAFFAVGAGKYYRDYYKDEPYAQFQNVSLIHIPNQFNAELTNFKFDIAVIKLTSYLTFSPFVAPVCIDWKDGPKKSIDGNMLGKTAGWGLNEDNELSADLRTATLATTSYADCSKSTEQEWAISLASDKFCVSKNLGTKICRGDSGGGFIVGRPSGRKTKHYLEGIASGVVPSARTCNNIGFATYTNIQYYEEFITNFESSNRPIW